MFLKRILVPVLGVMLLAACGPSVAGEYRADEFFGLDINKAALSPNRLGPPARFERIRVEASTALGIPARQVRAEKIHRVAKAKPVVARTKVVRKHTNPLDAQAFDTRVQVWPCRSGGICNWQR